MGTITELPEPICGDGYTTEQVNDLVDADRLDLFSTWMYGQILGICCGEHCDEPHGKCF